MTEVSVWRLNLLRVGYLILVVGLGIFVWPSIIDQTQGFELQRGVVVSMLGAMSLLAVLGLRYPLMMLPVLFFDLGWKIIWLLRVALPAWSADQIDARTMATITDCVPVVILLFVIPWDYVYRTYLKAAGDPWRSRVR